MLAFAEQKENEKKKIYKLYRDKNNKCSKMAWNIKLKNDKLDIIKRKNEYMKILICKLMKENNILK